LIAKLAGENLRAGSFEWTELTYQRILAAILPFILSALHSPCFCPGRAIRSFDCARHYPDVRCACSLPSAALVKGGQQHLHPDWTHVLVGLAARTDSDRRICKHKQDEGLSPSGCIEATGCGCGHPDDQLRLLRVFSLVIRGAGPRCARLWGSLFSPA